MLDQHAQRDLRTQFDSSLLQYWFVLATSHEPTFGAKTISDQILVFHWFATTKNNLMRNLVFFSGNAKIMW